MADILLKIKRIDPALPLPAFQTKGAACIDLYARLDTAIEPQSFGRIPLNAVVQIPPGYWGLLAVRSSTHKTGLLPGNGLGVIDQDYCGEEDELTLVVFNPTPEPITVERGTRIAQYTVVPLPTMTVEEVTSLNNQSRGAFGTTGNQ